LSEWLYSGWRIASYNRCFSSGCFRHGRLTSESRSARFCF
jgi:hypothetical protein